MLTYSTREAARKLGITQATLSTYIKAGKVPAPKTVQIGRLRVHSWTEAEVEHLRKLLPKIANGRKTRYKKAKKKPQARALHGAPGSSTVPHKNKQSALSNQRSAKTNSKATKKK